MSRFKMAAPSGLDLISYRRRPSWNLSEIRGSISQSTEPLQPKSLYIQNQWASAILIHFGQVLGKLNFSPVLPSPAANMRCKKKILYIRNLWTRPSNIRWRLLKLTTRGPQGRHGSENSASNLLLSSPW